MKVCPRCQRTYTDDNLNFCLDDGSVLSQAGGGASLPDTVLINQPRMTAPNQPVGSQPGGQGGWGSAPSSSQSPQSYSMQPPAKSSKTWVWVVGILGLLALVCGGGLVGFFALIASQDTDSTSDGTPAPSATASPSGGRTSATSIDMSRWAENIRDADREYTRGELVVASKGKGFVMLASSDYDYDKADIGVSVRNVDDADTDLGYGLVFHSSPSPLIQDYAFVIDAKKKRYRVVQHAVKKETEVIHWTNYSKMKGGTEANLIEARDDSNKVALYINGDKVTTIDNSYTGTNGVPGIYLGGSVKAAFSKLEIRK